MEFLVRATTRFRENRPRRADVLLTPLWLDFSVVIEEIPPPRLVLTHGDLEAYFGVGGFYQPLAGDARHMDFADVEGALNRVIPACRSSVQSRLKNVAACDGRLFRRIAEPTIHFQLHGQHASLSMSAGEEPYTYRVGLNHLDELPPGYAACLRSVLPGLQVHDRSVFLYDVQADPNPNAGIFRTALLRATHDRNYLAAGLVHGEQELRARVLAYLEHSAMPPDLVSPPTRRPAPPRPTAEHVVEVWFDMASDPRLRPPREALRPAPAPVTALPADSEQEESFSL